MSDKLQTISAIDLETVAGGFTLASPQANAYVDCHDRAVSKFNKSVTTQQSRWWEVNPDAYDNFTRQLQNDQASCIANHRIGLNTDI
jgi:hypothetical protein